MTPEMETEFDRITAHLGDNRTLEIDNIGPSRGGKSMIAMLVQHHMDNILASGDKPALVKFLSDIWLSQDTISLQIAQERIAHLEKKIADQEKEIAALQSQVDYQPGKRGYYEAAESFKEGQQQQHLLRQIKIDKEQ